jgi:hypothetical protein
MSGYNTMNESWESEIAALLQELADVQGALLGVLEEKRQLLASRDHQALAALASREQHLIERLQACYDRRQQLLSRAEAEGMAADSIGALSEQLPPESRNRLRAGVRAATERSRLLQHQSLTNWVLVQRTLLHLSQLIEIIATGGRLKPTYGQGSDRAAAATGALVDRAA